LVKVSKSGQKKAGKKKGRISKLKTQMLRELGLKPRELPQRIKEH